MLSSEDRAFIWQVLESLAHNLEPVASRARPQVAINAAVLYLAGRGLVMLTESGPQLTSAGYLCARAARGS